MLGYQLLVLDEQALDALLHYPAASVLYELKQIASEFYIQQYQNLSFMVVCVYGVDSHLVKELAALLSTLCVTYEYDDKSYVWLYTQGKACHVSGFSDMPEVLRIFDAWTKQAQPIKDPDTALYFINQALEEAEELQDYQE